MPKVKNKKREIFKGDVIHIRVAEGDKSLIEKAADSGGLTISSFMLQHSLKAARRELSEVLRTTLSKRDAETFFSALRSKLPPNEALKAAFKSYGKHSK